MAEEKNHPDVFADSPLISPEQDLRLRAEKKARAEEATAKEALSSEEGLSERVWLL